MSSLFQMRILRDKVKQEWFQKGYPIIDWNTQEGIYADADYTFDGDWLTETVSDTDYDLKYPLTINPFHLPVGLHVSFLYGEHPDGADGRVTFEVELWDNGEKKTTGQATDAAERMTAFLNTVWSQNNAHSLQTELGLNAQIYGGAVGGVYYDPQRTLDQDFPLSIQAMDVPSFYPVWSSRSYDELIEVIIAYGITKLQAEDLGIAVDTDVALYMENWKKGKYEITVEDKVVSVYGQKASGSPLGNVIPYVYIPHPPRRGFYGTSLLKDKLGVAREINEQAANTGDIITEEAANIPAMRNARAVEIRRISGTKSIMDLGFQQGDRIPEIMYPPTRSNSAQNADKHVQTLTDALRMEMYCPSVLFGGGDSSQRSTSSFAFMAIPLIAHIRDERAAFTSGFSRLNKYILNIAAAKGIGKIDEKAASMARVKCNWYPMLPRDTMEEVTSIIARVTAKILSPETAIAMIGDVLDISGELDKIEESERKKAENSVQKSPFAGATSGQLGGVQAAQSLKVAQGKQPEPEDKGEE